jgi:hypothetical protein
MGRLIDTGITHKGHDFRLEYREVNSKEKCFAVCTCD